MKLSKDGLTARHRVFVEAYLGEAFFNATEAARIAGLRHPGQQGYRLLKNVQIRSEISSRVSEAAMTANEVLARLNRIAQGDVDDFLDEDGRFDIAKARKGKKTGLLKKLKRKTAAKRVDARTEGEDEAETIETSIVHEEVEFEMYSAHEALRDLGKYHKLFTERHELTGKDGGAIEIRNADDYTDDELAAIAARGK